jgi:hypothetical protein
LPKRRGPEGPLFRRSEAPLQGRNRIFPIDPAKIFIPQWLRAINQKHPVQNLANKQLTCKILWNKELHAVFCVATPDFFSDQSLQNIEFTQFAGF